MEYQKRFVDNDDTELVIKKYNNGSIFIGITEHGIYSCFAVEPHQFKAIRKAIKKVTKEDATS